MQTEIVDASFIDDDTWQSTANESPDAWVEHRSESSKFSIESDRSFAVLDGGRVAAIVPARIVPWQKGRLLSGCGPAVVPGARSIDRLLVTIATRLAAIARENSCAAIWVQLPALAPSNEGRTYWNSVLPKLGCSDALPWGDTLAYHPGFHNVIDLRSSHDKIIAGFSESHRRALKRSRDKPVQILADCGAVADEAWSEFVSIHRATFDRTHADAYTASFLSTARLLVESGLGILYRLADGNGECAAALVTSYKRRAAYFIGGCADRALKGGLFVRLHWEIIKDLKERDFVFYDLGPTFPTLAGTKMGHIGEFKRRFGGLKWPVLAGEKIVDDVAFAKTLVWPRIQPVIIRSVLPGPVMRIGRRARRLWKQGAKGTW